mmetsp:Transcript_9326/g.26595  ORF Transcript_9326/g.26595 Transcript_9326/m.26595 type:complete len:308 (-) Transcript_9326:24-947(-)
MPPHHSIVQGCECLRDAAGVEKHDGGTTQLEPTLHAIVSDVAAMREDPADRAQGLQRKPLLALLDEDVVRPRSEEVLAVVVAPQPPRVHRPDRPAIADLHVHAVLHQVLRLRLLRQRQPQDLPPAEPLRIPEVVGGVERRDLHAPPHVVAAQRDAPCLDLGELLELPGRRLAGVGEEALAAVDDHHDGLGLRLAQGELHQELRRVGGPGAPVDDDVIVRPFGGVEDRGDDAHELFEDDAVQDRGLRGVPRLGGGVVLPLVALAAVAIRTLRPGTGVAMARAEVQELVLHSRVLQPGLELRQVPEHRV